LSYQVERQLEVTGGNKVQIKVPAVFYQDHCDRSNNNKELINAIIKPYGYYFVVELNDDQINELQSDAEYYAEGVDYPELHGVMKSAQATIRAIKKQVA
jgi:hypothetical protein